MSLEVVTTSAPIATLIEVKAYLRIDCGDEDRVLIDLIAAATDWVQDQTGQQITPATLRLTLDGFPAGREIRLPRPPLSELQSVTYIDTRGIEQMLDLDTVTTNTAARPGRIVLVSGQNWPSTNDQAASVQVEFKAGPTSERPLSPSLKMAVLWMVGHWYEHREAATDRTITDVPLTVQAVLNKHTFIEAI